jgi:flagellar hook-associated protein 3
MAVNAINVSRVSSTLQTDALLSALRRNTVTLYTEQNRLSVGRQFITPSDDPRRSSRALDLNQVLDQQDQLLTNIRHGADTLNATDSAMADVNDLINQAQSVASQNVGSLSSADERRAAAEVVTAIREQLVTIGNRQFGGRYLFAGRDTNQQPFVSAPEGVAYVGDTGDIFTRTDFNELSPINLPGNVLFGAISSQIQGQGTLAPRLTADMRIEDLRGVRQQGVARGAFEIVEEGGAGRVVIDLSKTDTVGDIVDIINTTAKAAGAGFTAALTDTGITLSPGGSSISVRDIGTGGTAADLGIVSSAPTSSDIVGGDIGALLSSTTLVTDLAAGLGVDLTGGLLIQNGERSATVDLAEAKTVQDIINAINGSGMNVRAQINANRDGIDVVNLVSGTSLSVGENEGGTASALGFRSLDLTTPLASLNNGKGVRNEPGKTDLRIVARNGDTFEVNIDGLKTVGEVIDAINEAATAEGVQVAADLTTLGNGIRLTDSSGGTGTLHVEPANLSFAADDLGISKIVDDPDAALVGDDVNAARANGLLTSLVELERALGQDDSSAITQAAEDMDVHLENFNRARGIVGARAKGLEDRVAQTESAVTATQSLLSNVQDLDYTEAVTRFQAAQTALQASLLTGSKVMSTSLMDYLG